MAVIEFEGKCRPVAVYPRVLVRLLLTYPKLIPVVAVLPFSPFS
jgi:hypothetical protein